MLTFGSDIHFRPIFRCAQQLVQISRHISERSAYEVRIRIHKAYDFNSFNYSNSFNYRETKASPQGRFGGAFTSSL